MINHIKLFLKQITFIELIFLSILIFLFTYSHQAKAYTEGEKHALVYFSEDCSIVSTNSFLASQQLLINKNVQLPSGTTFQRHGNSNSSYSSYTSDNFSKYPCVSQFKNELSHISNIYVRAVNSEGDYKNFTIGGELYSSLQLKVGFTSNYNLIDCPYPSFYQKYTRKIHRAGSSPFNQYTSFCNYAKSLEILDKNCLSKFNEEVDVYLSVEDLDVIKSSYLSKNIGGYLQDPNDHSTSIYCHLKLLRQVSNDNHCSHFIYKYNGDQTEAALVEMGTEVPPNVEYFQQEQCEYILTGRDSPVLDTDGDGITDDIDTDDDNDGYLDVDDVFPNDPNEWKDTDGDGYGDNSDAFPSNPNEWKDTDGDGIGDNADRDDDNDGIDDNEDAFPYDPSENKDTDGDGVGDNNDAFPNDPNEDKDTDGDGLGDNIDNDRDNDGIDDNEDAFPDDPSENKDTDGDGVGDNADPDVDGNGVSDNGKGGWYEVKYPNGFADVYDNKVNEVMEGSFGQFFNAFDFSANFSGSGNYPIFDFKFSVLNDNFSDKSIDISNLYGYNLWNIIKSILLTICMFYSFRIVVGM